jgi:hypothetical protein
MKIAIKSPGPVCNDKDETLRTTAMTVAATKTLAFVTAEDTMAVISPVLDMENIVTVRDVCQITTRTERSAEMNSVIREGTVEAEDFPITSRASPVIDL